MTAKVLPDEARWSACWWHYAVALSVVLIAIEFTSGLLGGGSLDPTDPRNFDHFTLVNDTGRDVTVLPCTLHGCGRDGTLQGNGDLDPGGRVEVSVPWGSGDHATFIVRSDADLGCVDLDAHRHVEVNVTRTLTSATPCPGE
jgi:hypothetical protein